MFYRSLKAPEAPAGGLPVPIPGEDREYHGIDPRLKRGANVQILILMRGMSSLELDVLSEAFPAIVFHSFEEFRS